MLGQNDFTWNVHYLTQSTTFRTCGEFHSQNLYHNYGTWCQIYTGMLHPEAKFRAAPTHTCTHIYMHVRLGAADNVRVCVCIFIHMHHQLPANTRLYIYIHTHAICARTVLPMEECHTNARINGKKRSIIQTNSIR